MTLRLQHEEPRGGIAGVDKDILASILGGEKFQVKRTTVAQKFPRPSSPDADRSFPP